MFILFDSLLLHADPEIMGSRGAFCADTAILVRKADIPGKDFSSDHMFF